jgi:hypothetical protein
MAHTHLLTQVEFWIPPLLEELAPGEKVTWQASFLTLPDPSVEGGGWVPVVCLYLEVPVTAENSFYGTTMLPPFALTLPQVRQAVVETLEQLVKRRDEYHAASGADKT